MRFLPPMRKCKFNFFFKGILLVDLTLVTGLPCISYVFARRCYSPKRRTFGIRPDPCQGNTSRASSQHHPPRSPHTIPPPQGNPAPSTPKEAYMCEFCSLSTPHVHGRDASDLSFSGFFSPGCIEIAVKKGLAARAANGGTDDAEVSDDDTDGT